MEKTIHAFIAIEIDSVTLSGIDGVANSFQKNYPSGFRWVKRENQHLTLKFLGDCLTDRLAEISQVLQTVTSTTEVFPLEISVPGAFPSWQRPRAFWLGIQSSEPLQQLFDSVDRGLAKLGFSTENKKFSPHLTLCRVSDHADPQSVSQLASTLRSSPPPRLPAWMVKQVVLFRSELKPGGPVYTTISKHILYKGV